MPTESRREQIKRRTNEIRMAGGDSMSREEATKLATAEADAGEGQGLLQPHGYDMETDPPPAEEGIVPPDMPEVESEFPIEPRHISRADGLDADKLVEEQEKEDPDKWSKLLDKETKVTGIDDLAKDAYETEPAQAPEGEEGYDSDALQQVGPFQEGNKFSMDETRERWAEEDKKTKESEEESAQFEKDQKAFEEGREKFKEETQSIIAEDDAAHEERLSQPVHPAHITDKDSVIIQELEELIHNQHQRDEGVSRAQQTANESPVLQQYFEEKAAKEAARQAGIDRGVVSRGIMDDPQMISTTRRVNAEVDAKNEALRREGFEVDQETIPVIDLEGGGAIGGGLYAPSLTETVNVYNEKGDVIRQIQKDIPGAREELAQRMAAEGKVRMRATKKGGYVRAAADEPYSRSDIYMSESQADRAESTAKDRIAEKKRRKGLWHKNMEGKYKYGSNVKLVDSKSPHAYGKDAASVRIAEIMAEAEKAKADAAARIKADDTLNDHQKELALVEARGEIEAKAAAARAEVDKTEGDANRLVTTQGQEAEFGQTDAILKQKAIDGRRIVLENEIARLRERIDNPRNLDDSEDALEKLEQAEDALNVLNTETPDGDTQAPDDENPFAKVGEAATTDPEEFDEFDDADIGELEAPADEAEANNGLPIKDATQFLTRAEPDLFAELNTDAMNLMFSEDSAFSFDETDLVNLYVKLKEFFDSNKIDETNIRAAGPYINSRLAGFHRETIEEFRYSFRETDGNAWRDIYNFFEAIKNGNMPPPPEGVPPSQFSAPTGGHTLS